MSSKENPNGLFSKVAKFVRNPTTNWADLERPEAEQEPGYSKQALKEMIERKRQNDFVRKREFDQLRKLRSRGPGGAGPDMARPSYFQTSLPANPDERAMTIKKIDEIEAQMSNQWWQGKQARPAPVQGAAADAAAAAPVSPSPASIAGENALAEAKAYAPTRLSPMQEETLPPDTVDFPPTRPNSTFGKNAATTVPGASKIEVASQSESAGAPEVPARPKPAAPPAFAHSQTFAVEMVPGVSDPDLEEAAIRFANGDNQGAEQGLLAALAGPAVRQEQAERWNAALFDLYRATGQQKRFDSVAIAYAERYGRSAPAWFSIPEQLGQPGEGAVERTRPTLLAGDPAWRSPPLLDRAAVAALQTCVADTSSAWHLDWTELRQIAPEAIAPLAELVAGWCDMVLQLRLTGADQLTQVLRLATPAGNREVDTAAWRLRMDTLRLMRLQDAFELVALEYCLTFEVSPPAWQDPRCGVHSEPGALGEVSVVGELPASGSLPLASGFDADPAPAVELSGEILGEAADALDKLEAARQGARRMVISCANLIRVDFSAAGSLLNWVATREAEGCQLQFREVHRLVAAFFHVIGIHEHARVVVRTT